MNSYVETNDDEVYRELSNKREEPVKQWIIAFTKEGL